MKKLMFFGLSFVFCFLALTGCANDNAISVSMVNTTKGDNTQYNVAVNIVQEKDYEDYYTDLMIKTNTVPITVSIAKEMGEFVDVEINSEDEFKSLTALVCASKGKVGSEKYTNYKDAVSVNLIIKSNKDAVITLRAVVGTKQDNAYGGELLTDKISVSKDFQLEVKKYSEQVWHTKTKK